MQCCEVPECAPLLPVTAAVRPGTASRRVLRPLLAAVAFYVTAVAMTIPVKPKLILAAAGSVTRASYFTGGVDAAVSAVEILSTQVLGAVSDIMGRRPVLMLAQAGELIALLLIARFSDHLAVYVVAYFLIGITGAYFVTVNTMIADMTSENVEGDGDNAAAVAAAAGDYGKLGATIGACFMIGPALGGFVEEALYPTASFHGAAILVAVSFVIVFAFVPETLRGNMGHRTSSVSGMTALRGVNLNPIPRIEKLFACDALRWLAAACAISSLAQGGLNSIFFLYMHTRLGWGSSETGAFLSAVGLSLLISQGLLASIFVHRFGERPTIIVGFAFSTLHYIAYSRANSPTIAYLGLAMGVVSFAAEPVLKGLLSRQVPASQQGALQGSFASLTAVLRPFSPLFASTAFGYGVAIGEPGIAFVAISVVSFAAFGVIAVALSKSGLK
jgi:MFS transporter, DHA1 family, tetracycline resistance protein